MHISIRSVSRRINLWVAIALVVGPLHPLDQAFSVDECRLTFYHTQTKKTLDITYATGGEYVDSALAEINEFLADSRIGDMALMDRELLGKAITVRLRGVPTASLRDAAIALQRGGVSYYEQSDFVRYGHRASPALVDNV